MGLKPPKRVRAPVTPGFRRTLVGLKHERRDLRWGRPRRFQTDPCGVEAAVAVSGPSICTWFQTAPCGVEASGVTDSLGPSMVFQTDPCGVEASRRTRPSRAAPSFRRTLVGLKPSGEPSGSDSAGFRRTLVGLKPEHPLGEDRGVSSFRRTLVGLKPAPPLHVLPGVERFRRTLVGLKRQIEVRLVGIE